MPNFMKIRPVGADGQTRRIY